MDLVLSFSKPIACILCVLLTLSFLFVKFLTWITGSSIAGIAGILVIMYGIYKLLRQVGTFALYPGSVSYIKADYQIRGSQRLIQIIMKSLQQFYGLIYRCQQHADTAYLAKIYLNAHIKQTIRMLAKFQDSLSDRKKQLLRTYRNIDAIICSVYQIQDISFTHQQFMQDPNQIRQMLFSKFKNNNRLKVFAQQLGKKISIHTNKINQILNQLTPSQQTQRDTLKMSIYRLYTQKLYQIRFAFLYWDPKFQYSIHLFSSKNVALECAVIQGPKNNPIKDNKCVIICCPNGAYAQYFALESQYISMYLQMGYKIVLWNYRGYGQSTGDPTISNCIQDAQQIYKYVKTVLQLDPQISHGYSIGGPPAAYLAYKNPFKILIIDRSFCNFINIAHQISPFLAKLARIVMKDDSNVNISQIYMKIRNCNKILIWSAVDEIVSNGSSLKLGILKRISVQLQIKQILIPNSPVSIISEAQLTQKNKLRNQNTLKTWLQKVEQFFQMISSLHEAEKLQQNSNSTFILNSSKQSLSDQPLMQLRSQLKSFPTNSQIIQRKQKVKEILSKFWEIVGRIDGGGTQIKFLQQLAEGGFKKSSQLHIQIKSFVLGLIYFGSCYHQGDKLNKDNFDNWLQTIISLTNADKQLQNFIRQNELVCPVRLMEYIKLFHSILKEMRNHLQKLGRIQNGLGLIVPTQSGHNGDLTKTQMQYLKAIIQSTKNNLQERNCLGSTQINQ